MLLLEGVAAIQDPMAQMQSTQNGIDSSNQRIYVILHIDRVLHLPSQSNSAMSQISRCCYTDTTVWRPKPKIFRKTRVTRCMVRWPGSLNVWFERITNSSRAIDIDYQADHHLFV
ncbi:uncharacterized protein LOC111244910 [Varroa destructor]|uniref:Uncharacterized protein n=1 Tax=Varroa destructor TaxID=109461 RepID=A0A7M7JCZ6_VARDE|nr:uncharacterized protein LOC111244910 [Varroa destructor]